MIQLVSMYEFQLGTYHHLICNHFLSVEKWFEKSGLSNLVQEKWLTRKKGGLIKFIYSEKATKFCEIFTLLLSVCTVDKK